MNGLNRMAFTLTWLVNVTHAQLEITVLVAGGAGVLRVLLCILLLLSVQISQTVFATLVVHVRRVQHVLERRLVQTPFHFPCMESTFLTISMRHLDFLKK